MDRRPRRTAGTCAAVVCWRPRSASEVGALARGRVLNSRFQLTGPVAVDMQDVSVEGPGGQTTVSVSGPGLMSTTALRPATWPGWSARQAGTRAAPRLGQRPAAPEGSGR